MKHRSYVISEIVARTLLVLVIFGLPLAVLAYQWKEMNQHTGDMVVALIARNDGVVDKPGKWLVQSGFLWEYKNISAPNVINVVEGSQVSLLLTSVDTVHHFSLPDLEISAEVIPGKVTEVSFVPGAQGEYKFECTTFCGEGHEDMNGILIVHARTAVKVEHQQRFASAILRKGVYQ